MPKIFLRSHVNSLKLSDNYAINDKIPEKKYLEKGHRKSTSAAKAYETERRKREYIEKEKSNCSNNTKTDISPASLVCSLPLYRIPGILDRINESESNSFNAAANYKCPKKDDKEVVKPCMKILCLYCDKIFSSKSIQSKHVEKMHTLSKTRRFSSRNSSSYLSESKTQHAPQSSFLHYYSGCCYCKNTKGYPATAKDFQELFFHMVDCHSEKYFGCKLCILRFQNRGKLTKHMNSVHQNTSLLIDESEKGKNESSSHISDAHTVTQHPNCSLLAENDITQCKLDNVNAMKNAVLVGEEPILSRLGVAQNRFPSNRKSSRHCRDTMITHTRDLLIKSDHSPTSSKIRNKIGKIVSIGDNADVVFRVPTRNDVSCIFEDDFYINIISNVSDNILHFLDGKIMANTSDQRSLNKRNEYCHNNNNNNTQVHKATNISTSIAFPTLLTSEQYGIDISTTKLKRSITKHSWKWKWDSFKKVKFVNEGGKIIKKIKQPILNLRDLSKLDMWTQLTMRQKDRLHQSITSSSFSGNTNRLRTEEMEFNNQLNEILDARILPEIILEQNDQTIVKLESSNSGNSTEDTFENSTEISNSIDIRQFFSILNLLPAKMSATSSKTELILSGEWARPRCYLCIGCGTKFEKLKSLEEHKMFRHSHVYSTHYEIVGRELMACNLLKHFFIPKRAFNRYENTMCHSLKCIRNKNPISCPMNVPPEDESFDSIPSSIHNCLATNYSGKNSTDDYDTDFKLTTHLSAISPTPSIQSASASDSMNSLQSKLNKDTGTPISCTKCRRKCSGIYDLYRHMLDCSGDYIWSMVKKRKYRYYCGTKKRRQSNKTYNKVFKKKDQKSLKDKSIYKEDNPAQLQKPKTPPRQRPSDAESIKKMLENLPPKRVCKKILPTLNKTRKSRLLAKRKIFNSQALKNKLSKRIRQKSKRLYKVKCKTPARNLDVILKKGDKRKALKFRKKTNEKSPLKEQKKERQAADRIDKCKESDRKVSAANNVISQSDSKLLLSESVPSSSELDCAPQEPKQITNSTTKSFLNGSKNKETLSETLTDTDGKNLLTSNTENASSKKLRSKKINDCIAMLTGKLNEKLKAETKVYECNGNDVNNVNCKKNVSSTNKAAKRKSRSRKIVKLTADNSTERISENHLSANNDDCHATDNINSQQTSTSKNTPEQITPHKQNKVNTVALDNNRPIVAQEVISNQSGLDADKSPSVPSLNTKEVATKLSIPSCDSLHLLNNQKLPIAIPSQQMAATSTYIKPNIPTRRQTICGRNSLSIKCFDDVTPLDLSTKTNDTSRVNVPGVASGSSEFISHTEISNKQFYSNLELLKIPQLKNPCISKRNNENCSKNRINSKRETSKNVSEHLNNCSTTKSLQKSSSNSSSMKKDNFIKSSKNLAKMNEVVINHIDEAINSVVNGESEKDKLENSQSNCGEEKIHKLLERTSLKEHSSIENLTPLKRSTRSKTVDHVITDKTNSFLCNDVKKSPLANNIKSKKVATSALSNSGNDFLVSNVTLGNSLDDANIKSNKFEPIQKQKRKRKNELAAIVADQLLESFKIDKAQRDNLKKLENLANEKSEKLLTEVLLLSATKRNASTTAAREARTNNHSSNNIAKSAKERKRDQTSKNNTPKSNVTATIKDVFLKEAEANTKSSIDHCLVKDRKKSERNNAKSMENEIILKTHLESITLNSTKKLPNTLADVNVGNMATEITCSYLNASNQKSSILRPSILSKTLESSNVLKDNKTIVYSRDPRLNKNIHKEENISDFRSSYPRNRFRSFKTIKTVNKADDIFDTEDDHYLHEIARNVNEKILSSENGDFKFVRDEFEVDMSTCPEDAMRPSTSMSVWSVPNLNEDCKFGSVDENTNTELIDMDIDMDNISVYTSFSQDVNRSKRRKKRRRSILLSRKQKKKIVREPEEKFECLLCKKTFFASSSLTKHQTTLAHVSKVSEQEYLLSKTKSDAKLPEILSTIETNVDEGVNVEKNAYCKVIDDGDDQGNEYNKRKRQESVPRLTLNPDEKLFFECCNILKGSQAGKTENYHDLSTKCSYLDKNGSQMFPQMKINEPLVTYCSKQNTTEKSKLFSTKESMQQESYQDQFISSFKKVGEIHTATDQNTSRFKTKAAMKGYENIPFLKIDNTHTDKKNISACKLTALAEIALGNENCRSSILASEGDLIQNNISQCFGKDSNEIIKTANLDSSKEEKKNATYSTTSSKAIMHFSVLKTSANQQETKCQSDKIIIPERPFKNIGLEEKEAIQFQRPKTNSCLMDTDNNSMSIASYSDRDDFDFGSLSCDDDVSTKICNLKIDKDHSTSNSSSRIGPTSFENKSLIMGRIFKNANGKNKKEIIRGCESCRDPMPKSDINRIFDELKGSTVKATKTIEENRTAQDEQLLLDDDCIGKVEQSGGKTYEQSTKKVKRQSSDKSINGKRRNNSRKTHLTKLKSELGMSTEEIAKLINEGQRKSKRLCATNGSKKLVEIWSSDEYEEFLSTKDIFALIEEKEKEQTKRKRKGNIESLNSIKVKEDRTVDNTSKCMLNNSKLSRITDAGSLKRSKPSEQIKVESNNTIKFNKKDSRNLVSHSKKNREPDNITCTKKRKTIPKQTDNTEIFKRPNGINSGCSNKIAECKLSKQNQSKKSCKNKSRRRSQAAASNSRQKRLASEKLYYWSSSSDEDFGRINTNSNNAKDFESGEQYQKHGWIVGDSHKKLVTLLAIAKGNKKAENRGVKKGSSTKKS